MKYTYDIGSKWIYDDTGKIICQFWSKSEYEFENADTNGSKIAAALNAAEKSQPSTATTSVLVPCCECGETIEVNLKKYHCQECFNKLTSTNAIAAISLLDAEYGNCQDTGELIDLINRVINMSDLHQ